MKTKLDLKTKTTILFDLDGTLLKMDQDLFLKSYLELLSMSMKQYGYEPQKLIKTILNGTYQMIQNNGRHTNEEVFWQYFISVYGEGAKNDEQHFTKFYLKQFPKLKKTTNNHHKLPTLIKMLKKQGFQLVLATNPVFPRIATLERMKWAGLDVNDFSLITTYENSKYAKPNPLYFQEILKKINVSPKEAIMIGNDTSDDLGALEVGMNLYFITNNLINNNNTNLNKHDHGTFNDFLKLVHDNNS